MLVTFLYNTYMYLKKWMNSKSRQVNNEFHEQKVSNISKSSNFIHNAM